MRRSLLSICYIPTTVASSSTHHTSMIWPVALARSIRSQMLMPRGHIYTYPGLAAWGFCHAVSAAAEGPWCADERGAWMDRAMGVRISSERCDGIVGASVGWTPGGMGAFGGAQLNHLAGRCGCPDERGDGGRCSVPAQGSRAKWVVTRRWFLTSKPGNGLAARA